jgi:hypothetical protein
MASSTEDLPVLLSPIRTLCVGSFILAALMPRKFSMDTAKIFIVNLPCLMLRAAINRRIRARILDSRQDYKLKPRLSDGQAGHPLIEVREGARSVTF